MRKLVRLCAELAMLSVLAVLPAYAQMTPLGEIVAGSSALIGSTEMPVGGTIFQGDRLTAHKDSTVIELANRGTIQLFPHTRIQVLSQDGEIRVRLEQGKVAFIFPKDVRTSIQSATSIMTPLKTESRYYGVMENTDKQDIVQAYEGELQVQAVPSGEKATIRPRQEACVGATAWTGHGDPITGLRLPIIVGLIEGGTATGIIIYTIIDDDEPVASPS